MKERPFYWNTTNQHRSTEALRNNPEDVGREIIAPGKSNIWICELGRRATDGDFAAFVARICTAVLQFDGLHVTYESPSQGKLAFGWRSPFTQDSQPVQLHDYPRYSNPYVHAGFATDGSKSPVAKMR